MKIVIIKDIDPIFFWDSDESKLRRRLPLRSAQYPHFTQEIVD